MTFVFVHSNTPQIEVIKQSLKVTNEFTDLNEGFSSWVRTHKNTVIQYNTIGFLYENFGSFPFGQRSKTVYDKLKEFIVSIKSIRRNKLQYIDLITCNIDGVEKE